MTCNKTMVDSKTLRKWADDEKDPELANTIRRLADLGDKPI